MIKLQKLNGRLRLAILASVLPLLGLTAQAQSSITSGLVAYWSFDKNNFEDSVGIFEGTENGADPIQFTRGKPGFGQAMILDGTDQMVEITGGEPEDLAFQGASMSVAGWFKVGAFDKSWQALIAKGEGSSWRVHRRAAETGFAHAGGVGEGPAGAAVDDGEWHHFAAISDVDAVNFGTALYVDGEIYTQFEGAPNLAANGQRVMIGENPDARNRYWNGEVDDIGIWDRVLTEIEISTLYANGNGRAISSLSGPVVDADNDGLPDWWEIDYGLNVNDASDAAADNNSNGVSNLEEFGLGLDPNDVTRPTILSAASSGTFDTLTLTFSKKLDPATAEVAANYTISPNLAVTGATYKNKVVTLTTANQTPDAAYTVTVTGIKDVSNFEVPADSRTVTFYSYTFLRTGVLKFSYWADSPGTSVDDLWADLRFPDSPDMVAAVFSFDSRDAFPDDSHDDYGAMIEGYLTPTESGSYDFFLRSDDGSELYIGTDDSEASLEYVAFQTGCCNDFEEPGVDFTTFNPITLTAGKKYLMRLIYKEGGGGDYGQVAWRKTTDTTPAAELTPIPSQYLSAAEDLPAPAEGAFVTQVPAPNATGVSPVPQVTIVHRDGKTEWTAENVSLKYDGVPVASTFSKEGSVATVTYKGNTLLASESTHTITLGYSDPGGNPATTSWSFDAADYKGPVLDKVSEMAGLIKGTADLTADAGGFSGNPGDRAVDLGMGGENQSVLIPDASFLNAATAVADEITFSVWVKKNDIANSSVFWADSPSSGGSQRGAQAHTPWSNNNVYFDTAGCCDGGTERIQASITTLPEYTDETWWTENWHHFAFSKNGSHKEIWIDGTLFLDGENTSPLPSDFTQIWLGAEGGGPAAGTANNMHGLLDDFSVFATALSATDVGTLASGALPTSLAASTKILAYWDFNELSTPPSGGGGGGAISIARSAGGVTITFEGTLQSSDSVTGPFTDVAGASSPANIPLSGSTQFFRTQ